MSDISPNHLRGFLLPLPLSSNDIWTTQSTFTTAEKVAGQAIPAGKEKLIVDPEGKQTNTIQLKTQKAGTPGLNKASFIWKRSIDPDYYGDNSHKAITDFQFLKLQTSLPTNNYLNPACLGLANGDLLLAYQSVEAVGLNGIVVKRMASDENTFSTGVVVATNTNFSLTNPAMTQLPDGSIILAVWANYTISVNTSNIYIYRSNDNGLTWTLSSAGALDEAIDTNTYTINSLKIAAYAGQVLLIAAMKHATNIKPDVLFQAASNNEGMSFTTIGDTANNIYCFKPSLVATDKGFLLTFITTTNDFASSDSKGESFLLPHAYFPFINRTNLSVQIDAGGLNIQVGINTTSSVFKFTEGDHTSYVDDENNIYVLFRNLSTQNNTHGGNGGLWGMVSTDNAETWRFLGNGSPLTTILPYIQSFNSNTHYLQDFQACTIKGKTWIFSQPKTTAGLIDKSLLLTCLRGYSSITLPARFQDASFLQQFGYNHTYLPIVEPTILPDWAPVATGAATSQVSINGYQIDTNTTSTLSYKYNFITPDANSTTTGIVSRFVCRPASGGSITSDIIAAQILISDASNSYKCLFRFSSTQIVLLDALAGTTKATITVNPSSILTDTGVEILVAMAAGKISAWWRGNDHLEAKGWNQITSNTTISNGGAGTSNYIQFGGMASPASGTATQYWNEVSINYKRGSNVSFFPNLADGFISPNDLQGKLYPAYGQKTQVGEGMFISTQDGPAQSTDEYTIEPASSYSIDNIFHGQSPTPQNQWRGQTHTAAGSVPSEFIAFKLDENGENIDFMSDLLGIHLHNINFREFKIEGYNASTSSWIVLDTISTSIPIKCFRRGNRLQPDPTGGTPHPYFFHNELSGSIVQMPTAGDPVYREILTNSEGSWNGAKTPRPSTIQLKDTQGSDPANPSATIIPKNATVVINLNGAQYSAIGIRISSQHTMTKNFRIGHVSIGPVHILAPQYSHGREITFTSNVERFEQPDGIIRTRVKGKGKRSFSISYTEPIDTTPFMPIDGTPSPNFYKASSDANARAVASYGGIAFDILGYIQHMQGPSRPVVYLPSMKYATNAAEEVRIYNRDLQHALVMLDDEASITNSVGEELVSVGGETFRISTIEMTEVI